ncbi:MAG: bifunctional diaminohydroxyphosphoribosylaminopyrimidine deaminase/5-amino-6-(5-phosphoribosylamino)uracil reductase RibD [Gammaproteobacteria bacterium]|nr:bifunctional diaminohydroxyphosphoribosylaminopyrimidine deaminase/5-amino-6-(5-phosphoribosylamino)uracil reductase RibD [Gammaproteobacteria bacterium]
MDTDPYFMSLALTLAKKGRDTTHPNPAVGCVIVKDGVVIAEGYHEFAGEDHAEAKALKQAGEAARGATMYVTLEPCSHQGRTPPCARAVAKANLARVVIAAHDPNPAVNQKGIEILKEAGIVVEVGVGSEQAKVINRGFFKRMNSKMPWVTMKTAISLDGRTAMANGESQWITSRSARLDAQKLRASSGAILTGVGTVLRDDPSMNVRLPNTNRQPLRVILDSHLSTPPGSKILDSLGAVLIVTSRNDRDNELFRRDNVELLLCPSGKTGLDPVYVMKELARREINTVMVEAGARLGGAMIQSGVVDELVVYMAPNLLGSDARDMFKLSGLINMEDKLELRYEDVRMVGRDLKLTLSINPQ